MASEPRVLPAPELATGEPVSRPLSAVSILALYSVGHFVVDLYSSALGVYQPLFAKKLGTTLTEAGLLGGMMVFAGSVLQLGWGYLSDRFQSRLFTVLAPAVSGLFISALGLGTGFYSLLLLVALGASGVASFHPQSSTRAVAGINGSRAKAMSIFISAGSLGYALGPMYFSAVLDRLPGDWGILAAIPGVVATLLLLALVPEQRLPAGKRPSLDLRPLQAVWKPMTVLYFLVFLRSTIQIAFAQLLPLYLSSERGYSLGTASQALSLYLAGGAIGGFAGGHVAEWFGKRRVIIASMIGSVPFLLLFFWSSGWLALAGLALTGLILLTTNPINIVMAQELAPGQSGTVSALMMGFSWGMAGLLVVPLAGILADHFSLHVVLQMFAVFPLIGFLLALKLPKQES